MTPAYAGQIKGVDNSYPRPWDHPRIRGTNRKILVIILARTGSPPHTRDKFLVSHLFDFSQGITPAYAGQISGELEPLRKLGDHPRIRGTNYKLRVHTYIRPGSPPHTRDK